MNYLIIKTYCQLCSSLLEQQCTKSFPLLRTLLAPICWHALHMAVCVSECFFVQITLSSQLKEITFWTELSQMMKKHGVFQIIQKFNTKACKHQYLRHLKMNTYDDKANLFLSQGHCSHFLE